MLGHCRNHHCLSVEFAKPFYATELREAWVTLKTKLSQYFFMFKNLPKTCWLQEDVSKVDDLLSTYKLQLSVWLILASLCGKHWKKSKANSLYFVCWLVLVLFRIISFLNILFISDFFFMSITHIWSWLITTMSF